MRALKIIGMIIVFSVCSAFGTGAAYALKLRAKSLSDICRSLTLFKNGINHSGKQLDELLRSSFKECRFVKWENGAPLLSDAALNRHDKELLNEFFKKAGTENTSGETEKAEFYLNSFETERQRAEKEAASKSRIFAVSGFCAGLTAAVLVL